jgi:hypothetical protein
MGSTAAINNVSTELAEAKAIVVDERFARNTDIGVSD